MFLIAKYGPTTCHITPPCHSRRYGRESITEVWLLSKQRALLTVSSQNRKLYLKERTKGKREEIVAKLSMECQLVKKKGTGAKLRA